MSTSTTHNIYLVNIHLMHLFQVSESPSSLGSLPTNTVNTTGTNTQIALTFKNPNGTVLARLNMASNLTISLASTKCQVC